jgi:hypothetical protein
MATFSVIRRFRRYLTMLPKFNIGIYDSKHTDKVPGLGHQRVCIDPSDDSDVT